MAGQLPLAIAQLLIKRIPPFRATSNNRVKAMTLVLHTHTDASPALGNQQDPILVLRQVSRRASRTVAFEFTLAFLLLPIATHVRWLLARLLPAHGRAARRYDEEVALQHGQAEVEGRPKIALSS